MSAESFFGLGVLFGLGFWPCLLIFSELILLIFLAYHDNALMSFISFVVAGLILMFISQINIFKYVWTNPGQVFLWVLIYYIPIGLIWSVFRWGIYVYGEKRDILANQQRFLSRMKRRFAVTDDRNVDLAVKWFRQRGGISITRENLSKDQMEDFTTHVMESLNLGKIPDILLGEWESEYACEKPSIKDSAEKAVSWIAFWPFSMICYCFSDLLIDVARWVRRKFSHVYDLITNWIFKDVDPRLFKRY